MKYKTIFLLVAILALGFFLRIYNINWDNGFHLHPDERAIVMAAIPIHLPVNLNEFFSPQSPLNPHFFAYGSFPMYLLLILSSILSKTFPLIQSYDEINILGRIISVFFDTGTIVLIFFLGKKIFNIKTGILAALLYSLSVLPIQLSHFYAVDVMLTFFVIATLFALIQFYLSPTWKKACLIGVLFGFSLAVKTSAIALIAAIGFTILADFIILFIKQPHKTHIWLFYAKRFLPKLFLDGFLIILTTIITFFFLEPYAFIDFNSFWIQNLQQAEMTKNAFIFPYTLQYVGKIPYWYEIKNIFFWGMGPVIGVFSFIGIAYLIFIVIKKHFKTNENWTKELILMIFFWSYFLVVGKFAVGWIRYMLPIYPVLAISGAVIFLKIQSFFNSKIKKLFTILFFLVALIWPFSFIKIYSKPNTRILASEWINNNILPGETIAVEHWDDTLPLKNQEKYNIETLELYNPDTLEKWQKINLQLKKSSYIIIASTRIYRPILKLSACNPVAKTLCYPTTSRYYKSLFTGNSILNNLKFKKIAEFSAYPKIPIINISINDQEADESFTVYDHPKIMIFKKSI